MKDAKDIRHSRSYAFGSSLHERLQELADKRTHGNRSRMAEGLIETGIRVQEDGALEELIEASREYVKLSDALPYKGALNRARLLDALEAIHPKEKRDGTG